MSNKGKGKRLSEFERVEIIRKLSRPNPPAKRAIAREHGVSDNSIRNVWKNKDVIVERTSSMNEAC